MAIVYKTYETIDLHKWDECIGHSANDLIYAKSYYLDIMSPGWQALVLNDYEAVMPLTSKKKWGADYLYQPAFVPQGGIFSVKDLTAHEVKAFIDAALGHFKFIEMPLNYKNIVPQEFIDHSRPRNNYVLDLDKDYQDVSGNYVSSVKKNLKRTVKFDMEYKPGNDPKNIVELYWKNYGNKMKPYVKEDFDRLIILFEKLQQQNNLIVRKVFSGGDLLAAAVFPFDGKRIYNLASYVSAAGREKEANYFLFDQLIKEFSGQPLLLDFEGSDVEGIAAFYRQFTSVNESYPFLRINQLPFPFRQLKALKDRFM